METFDFWNHPTPAEKKADTRASGTPEMPKKKYNIIYADPPWSYTDKGSNGSADNHYRTMTVSDICKLPVNPAGGGYCCRRLCFVYVGDIPNAAGGHAGHRGVGLYLQNHRFPMAKAKQERERLVFRAGTMDPRKHGTVPDRNTRKAAADQRRRVATHYFTCPGPQPET